MPTVGMDLLSLCILNLIYVSCGLGLLGVALRVKAEAFVLTEMDCRVAPLLAKTGRTLMRYGLRVGTKRAAKFEIVPSSLSATPRRGIQSNLKPPRDLPRRSSKSGDGWDANVLRLMGRLQDRRIFLNRSRFYICERLHEPRSLIDEGCVNFD